VFDRLFRFAAALLLGLLLGTGAAQAAPVIVLKGGEFRVQGSNATAALAPSTNYRDVFRVEVDGAGGQPMAGTYRLDGGELVFRPQFPLQPGVTYRAHYRRGGETASASFSIPKPIVEPSTRVEAIFPSSNVLPANQLKLYVHFSAPMSRGGALQRIHLYDDSGAEVERVFLGQELWDGEFRRLTVLFDPGRIKRGLALHEKLGLALRTGRKYTLAIDQDWPDARGVPLKAPFTKKFSAGPEDRTVLDPKQWRVTAPAAGTSAALTVDFPEALDHALVTRLLAVKDAQGRPIKGTIAVNREETRWSFTPAAAWISGAYEIIVPGILEDLAGNKMYTPFDVDVRVMPDAPDPSKIYTVPFRVPARAAQ
jgi:hypothetical protein